MPALFPGRGVGGSPAVLEKREILLPFLVFEGVLPFASEFIYSPGELEQEKFFTFYPFPHDIKFGKRLLLFKIKFRNTRNLIDNLSPLEITHLHDSGYITLHDDIVAMRFYPVL